jgi:hypothetical protein
MTSGGKRKPAKADRVAAGRGWRVLIPAVSLPGRGRRGCNSACWTTRCGNGQQAKVLEEEGARAVIGAARGKLARDKLL